MPRSHLALFQKYLCGIDEAQRIAVVGGERLAVGVGREQREVVLERGERHVRGEVVLGPGDREAGGRQRPRELRRARASGRPRTPCRSGSSG